MTSTFRPDIHRIKIKQQARYTGQRSSSSKLLSRYTNTYNGRIALPGPLKWSVIRPVYSNATTTRLTFSDSASYSPHIKVRSIVMSVTECLYVCPLADLNKSSAAAEMGDRLATINMGRKVVAAVSLSVGELGPHLTQCGLGRGLPPYQVAS